MFSGVGNVGGEAGLKTARIAPVQSYQIEEPSVHAQPDQGRGFVQPYK